MVQLKNKREWPKLSLGHISKIGDNIFRYAASACRVGGDHARVSLVLLKFSANTISEATTS